VDISRTPARTPPRDDLGRVLGGFGEPFGTVLGWFGSPGVVQMDMKIDTFRGKPRSPPQDMPRKALGRVLGQFGDFGEGFRRVSERFFKHFSINLVRFSCGILGNPREGD